MKLYLYRCYYGIMERKILEEKLDFLDKLYGARNYKQLLYIYDIDSDMTEEEIKEYEEEEYEYLIERGNKPNDIKKGFKFAKEIART
ncbi:hypothetical protein J5893_01870 [bacterium]|nr:hypothetical protein [bacterium]